MAAFGVAAQVPAWLESAEEGDSSVEFQRADLADRLDVAAVQGGECEHVFQAEVVQDRHVVVVVVVAGELLFVQGEDDVGEVLVLGLGACEQFVGDFPGIEYSLQLLPDLLLIGNENNIRFLGIELGVLNGLAHNLLPIARIPHHLHGKPVPHLHNRPLPLHLLPIRVHNHLALRIAIFNVQIEGQVNVLPSHECVE